MLWRNSIPSYGMLPRLASFAAPRTAAVSTDYSSADTASGPAETCSNTASLRSRRPPSFNRPVAPRLDLRVDPLVQLAHRARADPRAPQRFGDVFDSPHTHPGQDTSLPALLPSNSLFPVALDDRGLRLRCAIWMHVYNLNPAHSQP